MQLEDTGNIIKNLRFKNDKVIIETENNKIKVSRSTFDVLNLDVGDTLTIQIFKSMKNIEKKNEIIKYATNILFKRPYSEKELVKKLNVKFDNPRQIRSVISELKKKNLVNDKEFLNNYIEYFNKNYFGKYFIINFLRNEGLKDTLLNSLKFDDDLEKDKCISYLNTIRNKFVRNSFAYQKRKIYDAMLERGFSVDTILEVLNDIQIDEEVEFKQLLKLYKKAKNKYNNSKNDGSTNEAKIVSCLIENGYTLKHIQKVIKLDKEGKLND